MYRWDPFCQGRERETSIALKEDEGEEVEKDEGEEAGGGVGGGREGS